MILVLPEARLGLQRVVPGLDRLNAAETVTRETGLARDRHGSVSHRELISLLASVNVNLGRFLDRLVEPGAGCGIGAVPLAYAGSSKL
jgi:hypothetical protein